MQADAVLWSFGAEGRVPRLAQRRVILFFCPIRASSANQISSSLPSTACAISSKRAGKFFKSRHRGLVLGVMARTGRELAIVHGPQLARQRLLGDGDPELLPEPRDQVDQTPAHHTVDGRNGPLLDDGLQGRAMRVGEFRGLARRLAVDQALGPMGVELHHPVPHDLNRDPAEPGRRGAGRPLIDRGQRQKAPRLRAVLRRAGDRAQRLGIKVCPERNRHGEPPSFATLNQTCLKPTRPNRVTPSGTWYYVPLLPLYYVLVSIAAWRGLAELLLDPFRCNKTEHGLART